MIHVIDSKEINSLIDSPYTEMNSIHRLTIHSLTVFVYVFREDSTILYSIHNNVSSWFGIQYMTIINK